MRSIRNQRKQQEKRQIELVWKVEDVKNIRPDLNDHQCMHVLEVVCRNHNPEIGVNWMTLEYCAETLYPEHLIVRQ